MLNDRLHWQRTHSCSRTDFHTFWKHSVCILRSMHVHPYCWPISVHIQSNMDGSEVCKWWTTSLVQWLRHQPRERKIPDSNPAGGIFPGLSHTSDLKTGTPVATLPDAWRYRVSAWTGWSGVSILRLDDTKSWICNFYLSVAAR